MTKAKSIAPQVLQKVATGIPGFDELSHGGLPAYRTTLLKGGPGSGKTVFALQTVDNASRNRVEPGIFVTFEENPRQIIINAETFNWGISAINNAQLYFLDAHLS